MISIHAPRVGCDFSKAKGAALVDRFQSTHPVWGATTCKMPITARRTNFNPRTPCGVRRGIGHTVCGEVGDFNPRTPCGVRLQTLWAGNKTQHHFNPRTPCGVRLCWSGTSPTPSRGFQSTHPVWGATFLASAACISSADFNPRTPCGVRRSVLCLRRYLVWISIHAPRVGCDSFSLFLQPAISISIHAPRVGCDAV